MPTVNELIRRHLLHDVHERLPPLDDLQRTEKSGLFRRLCANRLIMGALRYGRMGEPGKPEYDRVACMTRRLKAYREDRNAEHLVDVANLAELEFVEGRNVWSPSDDGEHTKEK